MRVVKERTIFLKKKKKKKKNKKRQEGIAKWVAADVHRGKIDKNKERKYIK